MSRDGGDGGGGLGGDGGGGWGGDGGGGLCGGGGDLETFIGAGVTGFAVGVLIIAARRYSIKYFTYNVLSVRIYAFTWWRKIDLKTENNDEGMWPGRKVCGNFYFFNFVGTWFCDYYLILLSW